MHWVLLVLMQGAIHSVSFEDYQSCVNAGNKMVSSMNAKYICAEK